MTEWDELCAYVGFDAADGARLQGLLPQVEAHLPGIVDRFYERVDQFEGARRVFEGPDQVERLKASMRTWALELLSGPWDEAYFVRRQRIGRVHVRVGLPQRYMYTAMSHLRAEFQEAARAALPADQLWPTCLAIQRITDLDLAAMSGTYIEAHGTLQMRDLQALILENLGAEVYCLDDQGCVTASTNPIHSLGARLTDVLPADLLSATGLAAQIAQASAQNLTSHGPTVLVERPLGPRHYRVRVVPLCHPLAHVMVQIEDLTDVVDAQTRAQQAEALARIGGLATNVAHEIRNPLAAISATLQVIGRSMDAEDHRREILVRVNSQVLRLDRLVSDLLGYARPVEPKVGPVDLAQVVQEALGQAGAGAEVALAGTTTTQADPHYVQRIVVNLAQNARHAAGPDGRVRISVGPGPRVVVDDDGPGVPEAALPRIFEAFVTTKARGTGLGLAISRKLAESMGGSLHLAAEPAQDLGGARFVLRLPNPSA